MLRPCSAFVQRIARPRPLPPSLSVAAAGPRAPHGFRVGRAPTVASAPSEFIMRVSAGNCTKCESPQDIPAPSPDAASTSVAERAHLFRGSAGGLGQGGSSPKLKPLARDILHGRLARVGRYNHPFLRKRQYRTAQTARMNPRTRG